VATEADLARLCRAWRALLRNDLLRFADLVFCKNYFNSLLPKKGWIDPSGAASEAAKLKSQTAILSEADMYDLIVKGGTLIDPAQGIVEPRDVAINEGRIEAVEIRLPAVAKRVLDAEGLIVTPGLVDLHVHAVRDITHLGIDPDTACLRKGVTTILEAGSVGELLFQAFKKHVIDASKTRIYALLNIGSLGLIFITFESVDNKIIPGSQKWRKLLNTDLTGPMFIHYQETVEMIENFRDIIKGIKWHSTYGLRALKAARRAADEAGCLIVAENHLQPETFHYIRRGDILTHIYNGDRTLDDDGNVLPELFKAQKRGVTLDVGHGAYAFDWHIAEKAIQQGLKPDTISSDLHFESVGGPVHDLPTTMTKFLFLGLSLVEVVRATTARPAEALGKLGEIGTVKPGSCADLALFKLQEGKFPLYDSLSKKRQRIGTKRLVPVSVVRGGQVLL
jgi:dihydroorotase